MVDNDGVTCSSTPSWACANGVCFWCGFNDEKVVAFDVSDEVLAGNRFEYGRTFTVLNELVAMIVFPKNEEEKTCFDIWVFFEFGVKKSWTRLVRIGRFLGLERPLGEGQLVLCDPFTLRLRNLHVDGVKGSLQTRRVRFQSRRVIIPEIAIACSYILQILYSRGNLTVQMQSPSIMIRRKPI
ncbi:hypothetical protein CFP56_022389 [Quercus suber]|uniref:F-box associated domain-containing protein n=1 Tax=Quercus suber TaxID=58331 RepID=A0AAW0KDC0_QUESU